MSLDDSSTHTFTSCSWKDCKGTQNPAILFSGRTNSHLEVQKCSFNTCTNTNRDRQFSGGAINAYNVKSVTVSYSLFLTCKSTQSSGGGVNLFKLLYQPYIHNCDFISCHAADDGGGAAIWNSSATENQIVCYNCRFIDCSVPNEKDNLLGPVAGGIILWDNILPAKCSSLLFSSNEATYGGAYACHSTYYSLVNLLFVCLFNKNIGTYGNDIYLHILPSDSTCVHCFSTTNSDRIGYYSSGHNTTDAAWFP